MNAISKTRTSAATLGPQRLRRLIRCAVVTLVCFPLTSFGVYQLFLHLYSPPRFDASRSLSLQGNCPPEVAPTVVLDDACSPCALQEMDEVQLCVQTDAAKFIGHAFIRTSSFATGFRTHERDIGLVDYLWPWARPNPGYIRNDDRAPFDFELTYRACPATRARLEQSIFDHAVMSYQVGNWRGGRNCATWAADRLRAAGLVAPAGDCPNRMARWMRPVATVERSALSMAEKGIDES